MRTYVRDHLLPDSALDPRRCSVIREDGGQCQGFAGKTGLCPGHARKGLASSREAASEAGRSSGSSRFEQAEERRRTPAEVYSRGMVEAAEDILRLRVETIRNEKLPVADRLAAARDLENRALGKPKERVEMDVVVPDDIVQMRALPTEDLERLYAQLGGGSLAQLLPASEDAAEVLGYEDGQLLPE